MIAICGSSLLIISYFQMSGGAGRLDWVGSLRHMEICNSQLLNTIMMKWDVVPPNVFNITVTTLKSSSNTDTRYWNISIPVRVLLSRIDHISCCEERRPSGRFIISDDNAARDGKHKKRIFIFCCLVHGILAPYTLLFFKLF